MANLKKDTVIDHYTILSLVGAGGMGEVYKARDTRLGRDVAIKLLPANFARDEQRMLRFEQEAKAAGMLNHPNIMAVYDVGIYEGSPYLISELLSGKNLRERIREAPLPVVKAIEYSMQIARGLSAAHEKGIVHRDLKPENIFVTADGFVKILDFGLAKQIVKSDSNQNADTAAILTEPGSIMGTVFYMSPEQVLAKPADHRSDIFSFGVVFWEMLTGNKIFESETSAETMTSIIRKDVSEIISTSQIPPQISKIIVRCLEKDPGDRFQSMKDLAFAIESLSEISRNALPVENKMKRLQKMKSFWVFMTIFFVLLLSIGIILKTGLLQKPGDVIKYRQITFNTGTVFTARFGPDIQTIYYSAIWGGKTREIYASIPEGGGSRPLGIRDADVVGISESGEMAILLRKGLGEGTLAIVPLNGGPPKELITNISSADWDTNRNDFAVVRNVNGKNRLEFPVGRVLCETSGFMNYIRISPDSKKIAFLDHPYIFDDRGSVAMVDLNGNKKTLSGGWNSIEGLAWKPDGKEILFTSARVGGLSSLYGITLKGKERLLANAPGRLVLHDVSRDGTIIAERNTPRSYIVGVKDNNDIDLSWLDYSILGGISKDWRKITFFEGGEGGGNNYPIYTRDIDESIPLKVGEGRSMDFSPDSRWILTIPKDNPHSLTLYPVGAGESKAIKCKRIKEILWAGFFPDGNNILIWGNEEGKEPSLYILGISNGEERVIAEEGIKRLRTNTISPDGKSVLAQTNEGFFIFSTNGGKKIPIKGLKNDDLPFGWSDDRKRIYVREGSELPAKIFLLDLTTGERTFYISLMPKEPAGVLGISKIVISDAKHICIYNYSRLLSDLYLISGIK